MKKLALALVMVFLTAALAISAVAEVTWEYEKSGEEFYVDQGMYVNVYGMPEGSCVRLYEAETEDEADRVIVYADQVNEDGETRFYYRTRQTASVLERIKEAYETKRYLYVRYETGGTWMEGTEETDWESYWVPGDSITLSDWIALDPVTLVHYGQSESPKIAIPELIPVGANLEFRYEKSEGTGIEAFLYRWDETLNDWEEEYLNAYYADDPSETRGWFWLDEDELVLNSGKYQLRANAYRAGYAISETVIYDFTIGTITGDETDGILYVDTDGGLTVVGMSKCLGGQTLVIPDEVNGKPVVSVSAYGINIAGGGTVTLPKTLKTLEPYAFYSVWDRIDETSEGDEPSTWIYLPGKELLANGDTFYYWPGEVNVVTYGESLVEMLLDRYGWFVETYEGESLSAGLTEDQCDKATVAGVGVEGAYVTSHGEWMIPEGTSAVRIDLKTSGFDVSKVDRWAAQLIAPGVDYGTRIVSGEVENGVIEYDFGELYTDEESGLDWLSLHIDGEGWTTVAENTFIFYQSFGRQLDAPEIVSAPEGVNLTAGEGFDIVFRAVENAESYRWGMHGGRNNFSGKIEAGNEEEITLHIDDQYAIAGEYGLYIEADAEGYDTNYSRDVELTIVGEPDNFDYEQRRDGAFALPWVNGGRVFGISGYHGEDKALTVGKKGGNGAYIRAIWEWAFEETDIESLDLTEAQLTITDYAFGGAEKLTEVKVGPGVVVTSDAFSETAIRKITGPADSIVQDVAAYNNIEYVVDETMTMRKAPVVSIDTNRMEDGHPDEIIYDEYEMRLPIKIDQAAEGYLVVVDQFGENWNLIITMLDESMKTGDETEIELITDGPGEHTLRFAMRGKEDLDNVLTALSDPITVNVVDDYGPMRLAAPKLSADKTTVKLGAPIAYSLPIVHDEATYHATLTREGDDTVIQELDFGNNAYDEEADALVPQAFVTDELEAGTYIVTVTASAEGYESSARTLTFTLTEMEALDAPTVTAPTIRVGNNAEITWTQVENAETYYITIIDNKTNEPLDGFDGHEVDEQDKQVLPADALEVGTYTVRITAWAFGYAEATGEATLTVEDLPKLGAVTIKEQTETNYSGDPLDIQWEAPELEDPNVPIFYAVTVTKDGEVIQTENNWPYDRYYLENNATKGTYTFSVVASAYGYHDSDAATVEIEVVLREFEVEDIFDIFAPEVDPVAGEAFTVGWQPYGFFDEGDLTLTIQKDGETVYTIDSIAAKAEGVQVPATAPLERGTYTLTLTASRENYKDMVRTKTINVLGKLAVPEMTVPEPAYDVLDVEITWEPVPNATGYALTIAGNDEEIEQTFDSTATGYTVDVGVLPVGRYTVKLTASAEGYAGSEAEKTLEIREANFSGYPFEVLTDDSVILLAQKVKVRLTGLPENATRIELVLDGKNTMCEADLDGNPIRDGVWQGYIDFFTSLLEDKEPGTLELELAARVEVGGYWDGDEDEWVEGSWSKATRTQTVTVEYLGELEAPKVEVLTESAEEPQLEVSVTFEPFELDTDGMPEDIEDPIEYGVICYVVWSGDGDEVELPAPEIASGSTEEGEIVFRFSYDTEDELPREDGQYEVIAFIRRPGYTNGLPVFERLPFGQRDDETKGGLTYRYDTDWRAFVVSAYDGSVQDVEVLAEIDGVPVKAIDDDVFEGKTLNSVTLPDSLEEISGGAFLEATVKEPIVIKGKGTMVRDGAFLGADLTVRSYAGSTAERAVQYANAESEKVHIGFEKLSDSLPEAVTLTGGFAYADEDGEEPLGAIWSVEERSFILPEGAMMVDFIFEGAVDGDEFHIYHNLGGASGGEIFFEDEDTGISTGRFWVRRRGEVIEIPEGIEIYPILKTADGWSQIPSTPYTLLGLPTLTKVSVEDVQSRIDDGFEIAFTPLEEEAEYLVTVQRGTKVLAEVANEDLEEKDGKLVATIDANIAPAGTYDIHVFASAENFKTSDATAKLELVESVKLAKPVLEAPESVERDGEGEAAVDVTFAKVDGAVDYTVTLTQPNEEETVIRLRAAELDDETMKVSIGAANLTYDGTYTLRVIAIEKNEAYSSDAAVAAIEVVTPQKATGKVGEDEEDQEEIDLTVSVRDDEASVLKVETGADGNTTVEIPSTVMVGEREATVTEIAAGAFKNDETTKEVKLPDTVTTIGSGAFAGATNLEKIDTTSVETIGDNAFKGAFQSEEEKKVELPAVQEVGSGAFSGTNNLTVEITSPAALVQPDAFENANGLTVVAPAGSIAAVIAEQAGVSVDTKADSVANVVLDEAPDATLTDGEGQPVDPDEVPFDADVKVELTLENEVSGIEKGAVLFDGELLRSDENGIISRDGEAVTAITIPSELLTVGKHTLRYMAYYDEAWTQVSDEQTITVLAENPMPKPVLGEMPEDAKDDAPITIEWTMPTHDDLIGFELALTDNGGERIIVQPNADEDEYTFEAGEVPAGEYTVSLVAKSIKGANEDREATSLGLNVQMTTVDIGDGLTAGGYGTGAKYLSIKAVTDPEKTEITVPDSANGKPVVAIEPGAIPATVKSLTLPKTIRVIEEGAIPAGVTVTAPKNSPAYLWAKAKGYTVKESGDALDTFELPTALNAMAASALSGTKAEVVILPAGADLGTNALAGCENLLSVVYNGAAGDYENAFGEHELPIAVADADGFTLAE